jgi:hypothetical protein
VAANRHLFSNYLLDILLGRQTLIADWRHLSVVVNFFH